MRTLAAVILLLGACSDGQGPAVQPLTGDYTASALRVTAAGLHPVDMLAGGSTLAVQIAQDLSISGHLYVPAALTGDVPLDADMAGTASATARTVSFDQTADTFMRDLTFSREGADLVADQVLSNGVRYEVRLSR